MSGSVVYTGRVARTGIHHYPWGIARRDADELKNLSIQLPGKPVVVLHPSKKLGGKFKGGDRKQVGRIDSSWIDGDFAVARIVVEDEAAIHEITRGVRELSLGYNTDIVDGWDRNGRVDHLAFVPAARCGPECSIRLDSETRSGGGDAFKVQSMLRILKK